MKESNTNQITALYCRLSQEDLRAGESLSIENQRLLLKEYADKNGFKNCQYYIDDGYSGVNKNRPEYFYMSAVLYPLPYCFTPSQVYPCRCPCRW